ncbi:MAG: hypothetical protein EXR90_02455 [Methyloglobulus sp.]|nr:hypothetical protein [Methyloglobulus sp.]
MHIEKTHHVDASEPDADGLYEWRYEYDLYSFSDVSIFVVARTYVSEPDAVYFLHIEQDTLRRALHLWSSVFLSFVRLWHTFSMLVSAVLSG